MTDPIDISEPLQEICNRLGVDYNRTREIVFQPGDMYVTTYKTDEQNNIVIDHDVQEAVTEMVAYKVRT